MSNKELKRKIFLEATEALKESETELAKKKAQATRDYDNELISWEEFQKIMSEN